MPGTHGNRSHCSDNNLVSSYLYLQKNMEQRCALLWLPMRCHRDLSAARRCCPNGVSYKNMADTTNATYIGGIDVPHWNLSGAKITVKFVTSKLFSMFLKKREASIKSRLSYVLSYYNNYTLFNSYSKSFAIVYFNQEYN